MRKVTAGVLFGVLVACAAVHAQDLGWPPAPVAETGQTGCWTETGMPLICAGTHQDGDLRPGIPWPSPRFSANVDLNGDGDCTDMAETCDGTVTDNLTGLVWLADASCPALASTDGQGRGKWEVAVTAAASLASGNCGLLDGSQEGDWHLPSVRELVSLIDYQYASPPLSDTAGTGQWSEGDPFSGVEQYYYWSSTTYAGSHDVAWTMHFFWGDPTMSTKDQVFFVWPVRDGPAIFADGFGPASTQQW